VMLSRLLALHTHSWQQGAESDLPLVLYHFPEVYTILLLLLGRIQSVRCDK